MLVAVLSGSFFAIQNSVVQTFIIRKIAKELSSQINSTVHIGKVNVKFFNKLVLNDVLVEGQNSDTIFYTQQILAKIDTLKLKTHHLVLSELTFEKSKIAIEQDSTNHFNFSFILDSMQLRKDSSAFWKIYCNQFGFNEAHISYKNSISNKTKSFFVNNLNLDVSGFENFNDSVRFKIDNLNFNDGKKLVLKQLSANIAINSELIKISGLNLKSKYSEIKNSDASIQTDKKNNNRNPKFDFHLHNSKLSFLELAEIVPSLRGMDQTVRISGRVYGDIDDLKGKNIVLKTGRDTKAILDFYINGINDPESMYLFFDLKQSQTTISDIAKIKLPRKLPLRNLEFSDYLYDTGLLTFHGNFSGFLSDFVAFGTFKSQMGTLTTDLSVIPGKKGITRYRGNIATTNFKMKELFNDPVFGDVTFNGKVDGKYNKNDKSVSGFFKGDVSEIEINSYTYRNIKLEGLLIDKNFDGLISINDKNLKFAFLGQFDLNSEIPVFDFNLKLDKILPGKLNLSSTFPDSEASFGMRAKFSGNKLDNLKGSIIFNDGIYKNKNGQLEFKGVELKSIPGDSIKTLTFTSDFFDIEINGEYDLQNIVNTLKTNVKKFFPSLKYNIPDNTGPNIFDYRIDVKTLDELTTIFAPDFQFETPFLLYGKVDSRNSDFQLAGSIPSFIYKNILLQNVFLNNTTINNKYSSKFRFGEIQHRKGYKIYNLSVESIAANDVLNNTIKWDNNPDSTSSSTIHTQYLLSVSPDSLEQLTVNAEGFASDIFINDTIWHLAPFTSSFSPSSIKIDSFNIFNNQQNISVNGTISKHKSDLISFEFENIDLGYLEKYLERKLFLNGIMNGTVAVSSFNDHPAVISDLTIDSLRYKEHLFGNVLLTSKWDKQKAIINSRLSIINNDKQNLLATGFYRPGTKELDFNVAADSLSIEFLNPLIVSSLSEIHGDLTGNLKLGGTTDKIALNGEVTVDHGGVTVDYTQVHYTFSDKVKFRSDTIEFNNVTMADSHNNTGKFGGTLIHTNFNNMVYNLTISSPKIMVLNTTVADNELFYGQAYGNGKFTLKGKGRTVDLEGTATSLTGTNLNISMEYQSDVQKYDFIKFVTVEKSAAEKFTFKKEEKGGINIKLTLEVTPDAKMQLVYNSQIGDIIKAQGDGILLFEMDTEGNVSLSGDYSVVEGDYLFTLKNVLNKRFIIEQGGSIVWSGDPYNAIINLTATYRLKAALYDLMMESYLIQGEDIYQRIPVECKILLSEELTNPVINFEIEFPDEDESLKGILQQFINTEEEMNKQILSLIVLGKFYTPEYLRGQYEASNPNTLGNTASELFSNQLSNWLSKISSNVDVGFNYRPGNDITNDEIELALSTQIFNDRVILNGNIGNNVNPESNNSSQIVGDFDIKVKLVPNGKIMFKAFNRSNNDLIYDTAPYTQGIGFSFKEEYNTFRELLQKIGAIFKKKKRETS